MLGEEIRGMIGGNYTCLEWGGDLESFHIPSERMLTAEVEYKYAVMSLCCQALCADGPPAPKSLASPTPYSSCPRSSP